MQILSYGERDALKVIKVAPHIPLLADAGARRGRGSIVSPRSRHVEPDAELTRHEVAPHSRQSTDRFDIDVWLPARKITGDT